MTDAVLIVGAGPTGLALAIHLALHGVAVRVIDAAKGPATTSRALGLQPRGVEVLERIGALGDLPQRSQPMLTISYNEGPRTVARFDIHRAAALPKPTLLISQAEVEAALRDRLREVGGGIDWSTRLVGASQTTDGLTALVRDRTGGERNLHADWLIGCDGAHSAVRKAAGIGFPGRKLIERLLMVDVAADWPYDRNGSTTWMDTGRMVSVTALPHGVWRVFVEPSADVPDNLSESEVTDQVLGEFARRSGLELDGAVDVRWATEFRIHRRLAETYRRGRILLAGDAAHIQSPTGGQGQNTGLGDAENLGWKLALVARGRASQSLLDTYEAERRPLARTVLAATSTAVDIMLPNTGWKRLVRDRLVMPVMRVPAVQRRVLLMASQLGINYRGGPLAPTAHWWTRTPRPGDRVPDMTCRCHDGTELKLHSAIAGRWTMVARNPHQAARYRAAAAELLGPDMITPLIPLESKTRDVLLIRPDGHLAWRGHADPEQLTTWLREVLWPRTGAPVALATQATMSPSSTPHSTC